MSDLEQIRRFSLAFDLVLNGYRVPMQLRRFCFKLFTLAGTKKQPVTDDQLAEQFGGVSRSYIVKLRKQFKAFQNSDFDGVRALSFCSITENGYDPKTKRQRPTEYEVNKELIETIQEVSIAPGPDFVAAIKQRIQKIGYRLTDFGYYSPRKIKRERTPDQIFGTYLVQLDRGFFRFMQFVKKQGFTSDDAREFLHLISAAFIEKNYAEEIFTFGPNRDEAKSFALFCESAISYFADRTRKPETVFPQPRILKSFEEKNYELCNLLERKFISEQWPGLVSAFKYLDDQRYLGSGPDYPS